MNDDPSSLDRLHDIIEPGANVWWPLAAGWYWLIVFGLLFAIYLLFRSYVAWRHNCYRREALAELSRCEALIADPAQRPQLLYMIASLLKRTAVTAYPRTEVATLTGQSWFAFLDAASNRKAFATGSGELLERAVYDATACTQLSESQIRVLIAATAHWIASHNRDFERAGQRS